MFEQSGEHTAIFDRARLREIIGRYLPTVVIARRAKPDEAISLKARLLRSCFGLKPSQSLAMTVVAITPLTLSLPCNDNSVIAGAFLFSSLRWPTLFSSLRGRPLVIAGPPTVVIARRAKPDEAISLKAGLLRSCFGLKPSQSLAMTKEKVSNYLDTTWVISPLGNFALDKSWGGYTYAKDYSKYRLAA